MFFSYSRRSDVVLGVRGPIVFLFVTSCIWPVRFYCFSHDFFYSYDSRATVLANRVTIAAHTALTCDNSKIVLVHRKYSFPFFRSFEWMKIDNGHIVRFYALIIWIFICCNCLRNRARNVKSEIRYFGPVDSE